MQKVGEADKIGVRPIVKLKGDEMSDVMLLGVLRIPITADSDALTIHQFASRAREAADRIESDAKEIERLRADLENSRAEAVLAICSVVAGERERCQNESLKANEYAMRLAVSLHAKHYADVEQWKPLPDTLGLLTQIDNMVCGLVNPNRCNLP